MTDIAASKKIASVFAGTGTVLRSLLRPLGKILTFSAAHDLVSYKKAVAVSIEKGSVTVTPGSRVLSRIRAGGIRSYDFDSSQYPDPESVASSVSVALKEFDIKKARVALSIPKVWAVYKTAEFPATVRENLADVIRYELDRITPFSADETVYDFRVLSESNDRVSVLVAAANKKTVDPYLEAIKKKVLTSLASP